ncbi:MAG: chemotaxis protein CheX [Acidobacteria bacterium]|nr:chemotaxis protein CheX [Acidobacteriota bacterium]
MSSPISLQHLPGGDALAALGDALVRVAEGSLFAWAEPCDAARFEALLAARDAGEPWLSASVAFVGPFEGIATLSLPEALAVDLCASFSGLAAEDLAADQVRDFTGELANMACGAWLTHSYRSERFDLRAPVVSTAVRPEGATGAGASAGMTLNDAPIRLALSPTDPAGRS